MIVYLLRCLCVSASLGVLLACTNPASQSVASSTCPTAVADNALLLFGKNQAMTKGWSHIVKPEKAADFVGLKQSFAEYALSPKLFAQQIKPDPLCPDIQTFQTILVKKLHVWNNNHSNGIETHIPAIPVREWQAIQLSMWIDSRRTVIPSASDIQRTFPELTSSVDTLDASQANLYLVFRDGEQEAGYMITLDPQTDFDRWLNITIPAEDLRYSKKVDYVHTPRRFEDVQAQTYQTLSIKAETQSLKTVQHLNNREAPEGRLFKEIAVNINGIYLIEK